MHSQKIFSFILTLQVLLFSFCESQQCANPPENIYVSQSGDANFTTIQSAIDSIPSGKSKWIHIRISSGTYKERVKIPTNKACVFLEGAGRTSTRVQWDDHGTAHHTATFDLTGNNTLVKGITFENTYNTIDESKNVVPAVAVRVHADKCALVDCGFIGVQDTLFDSFGRHYYRNCYIEGHVDFIFGEGQSLFELSQIYFTFGNRPSRDGCITASERRSVDDPGGFVIKNCNINGTGAKTQLGRALEPGNPRVIIYDSFLADVIRPEGWGEVSEFVGHEANITFQEVECKGPGANISSRVPWINKLSPSEISPFLNISFIDDEGWIESLPIKIIDK